MEGVIALLIPLCAVTLMFGIPIVAILTGHQRKMAELYHNKNGNQQTDQSLIHEIRMLREEVARLNEKVNDQSLALDNLATKGISVQNRLSDTPQ